MTIVVTAATGRLGSRIVASLLARGYAASDILATARRPEALGELAAQGVRTARLDYSDAESVTAAIQPGDTLVLVSGSEVGQRVPQHTTAIEAATAAGVGRILYTSVLRASTTELFIAGEHKATEEVLAASGVPVTLLRNGWYTENYAATVDAVTQSGALLTSAGDGVVASATIADFAEGIAVAAMDDALAGQTLELAGDERWTQDDLAQAISGIIGQPVPVSRVDSAEHARILGDAGLDEGTIGFVVGLDAATAAGQLDDETGDLSRLLGRPTTSLAEGLRRAVPGA
ncbi:NAD(P)H-binding protein [Clavibacter sp. km1a]|uniref:NAD(P)H-binding protein n=1 Tax=Clavibacter sp. km1a TaxID=3459136 RepID=UPI004041455C